MSRGQQPHKKRKIKSQTRQWSSLTTELYVFILHLKGQTPHFFHWEMIQWAGTCTIIVPSQQVWVVMLMDGECKPDNLGPMSTLLKDAAVHSMRLCQVDLLAKKKRLYRRFFWKIALEKYQYFRTMPPAWSGFRPLVKCFIFHKLLATLESHVFCK